VVAELGEIDTDTGVVTVTEADADFDASAALTAVTVIEPEGTVNGAVYNPALDMVPTVAFPPAAPFTFQVTAVVAALIKFAENCCACPVGTIADDGDNDTDTCGALIVTVAEAEVIGFSAIATVTVTLFWVGATAGATYSPDVEMVPATTFPPAKPLTDQTNDGDPGPVTLALNCTDCPTIAVGWFGFRLIL
jgi:hypothetical protein